MNYWLPGPAEETSSHKTSSAFTTWEDTGRALTHLQIALQTCFSPLSQALAGALHPLGSCCDHGSAGPGAPWPRWGTVQLCAEKGHLITRCPKGRSASYPLYPSQGDKNICSSHLIPVCCAAELFAVLSWLLAPAAGKALLHTARGPALSHLTPPASTRSPWCSH